MRLSQLLSTKQKNIKIFQGLSVQNLLDFLMKGGNRFHQQFPILILKRKFTLDKKDILRIKIFCSETKVRRLFSFFFEMRIQAPFTNIKRKLVQREATSLN